MLNKLMRRIGQLQGRLMEWRNPKPVIIASENSIVLKRREEVVAELPWPMVTRVVASKRDEITIDTICLELHFVRDGMDCLVEINEDMLGFERAVEMMEQTLPSLDRAWRQKVVKPAFASNVAVIYEKPVA